MVLSSVCRPFKCDGCLLCLNLGLSTQSSFGQEASLPQCVLHWYLDIGTEADVPPGDLGWLVRQAGGGHHTLLSKT